MVCYKPCWPDGEVVWCTGVIFAWIWRADGASQCEPLWRDIQRRAPGLEKQAEGACLLWWVLKLECVFVSWEKEGRLRRALTLTETLTLGPWVGEEAVKYKRLVRDVDCFHHWDKHKHSKYFCGTTIDILDNAFSFSMVRCYESLPIHPKQAKDCTNPRQMTARLMALQ